MSKHNVFNKNFRLKQYKDYSIIINYTIKK